MDEGVCSMQLLKTKPGVEALRLLENPTASYLDAYQQGAKLPEPVFERELQHFDWDLQDNETLWRPDNKKSSRWICKLVFALLIRAKTGYLLVCHQMVSETNLLVFITQDRFRRLCWILFDNEFTSVEDAQFQPCQSQISIALCIKVRR